MMNQSGSLQSGGGINMNVQYSRKRQRDTGRNRVLLMIGAFILIAGLFMQITMLARIYGENKRASAIEREVVEMNAKADNLELSINQYHNLDRIAVQAQNLGMTLPDETQIRVVSVARNASSQNTSTQTAAMIGGGEILN